MVSKTVVYTFSRFSAIVERHVLLWEFVCTKENAWCQPSEGGR